MMETAADIPRRLPIVRSLALLACGTGLAWLVVIHSYVAYLAGHDPAKALEIRSDAVALLNLVEQRIAEPKSGRASSGLQPPGMSERPGAGETTEDRGGLRAWAERAAKVRPLARSDVQAASPQPGTEPLRVLLHDALQRDPLSARGYRLLGQVEQSVGSDRSDVARLMKVAATRSVHETLAVWWLMQAALDDGDIRSAIMHADTILRTQSRLTLPAVQTLSKISQTPEGLAQITRVLAENPPWRSAFLLHWPQYLTDARAPLVPLLALRETKHPPTPAELRGYLNTLMQFRFFDLAYYTWLQFLSPEQLQAATFPFNGSFEHTPSGLPFDWIIPKGVGVAAGLVARADAPNTRVLAIEFGIGRVEFAGVSQTILLPAGSYRFQAAYRAQVAGRRGLVWQLACLNEARTQLGASPMILGTATQWSTIEFDFLVPENGCPAQLVRLHHDARTPSEQLVTGWSFHDDVKITRLDQP